MTLRITVVPASTKVGVEVIRALLKDPAQPLVRAIYRDTAKAPADFAAHPNFKAVTGDVSTGAGLSFEDSDAVFYVPPPTYDGTPSTDFAAKTAQNVKDALQKAPSVKRLVLLSAMGAQHDKGIGIIAINHISEQILQTSVPEVVIARPAYFQEDSASAFETLRADPPFFHAYITPLDYKVTMISVVDIAAFCAPALLAAGAPLAPSPRIVPLHGPRAYSAEDVRAALERVAGKKVAVVAVEPAGLVDFFAQAIPAQYAAELAEMVRACMPGGLIAREMEKVEGAWRGRTELVDTLRRIAPEGVGEGASGAP